ncbi:MAG: retron Ec67 family RNA-directed DNA polymerase/endonuclease [Candidatus Poribacteria bacterium]|nr:retron Ec67 family RNA-directed DNA polymerase/endonuclease [Candidatus Poribacteria bacterium]
MSHLENIQKAQTLKDIAAILRVQAKYISYFLYKLPESAKYYTFEIPKRNGEMRVINAPQPRLKMLQRRLADTLYRCVTDIYGEPPNRLLSHGFLRSRSIFTNASLHKNRRYVLNMDLKDFFPSFNFGRVRGYFMKDNRFELHERVATIIAQIACHNNELPQGSPCSPIITNLIGHLLDVRLVRFAQQNKCSYSRYADDITFSTNLKEFPAELALPTDESSQNWQLSAALLSEIHNAGFEVNKDKTRMQFRGSRQTTTGLIVNRKVNVRSEYYKNVRAICHQLFSTGTYYISDPENPVRDKNKVEGMLNHLYYIKDLADIRPDSIKKKEPLAIQELYKRFLFYKHFVTLDNPLIVTEGKTDPIYLRIAIKKLKEHYPQLGELVDGKFRSNIRFMNYTTMTKKILQLGEGTSQINEFIRTYKKVMNTFKFRPLAYPVIVLVDNDEGAQKTFNTISDSFKIEISHKTTEPFYHLYANLYIIKTPESGNDYQSKIEDLFNPGLFQITIDGKNFDPSKNHSKNDSYGKTVFAKKVVVPKANEIDFSNFRKVLDRIVAVMDNYKNTANP